MKVLSAAGNLLAPLSQFGDHTVVIGRALSALCRGKLSEVMLDLIRCSSVFAYCFLPAVRERQIGAPVVSEG